MCQHDSDSGLWASGGFGYLGSTARWGEMLPYDAEKEMLK